MLSYIYFTVLPYSGRRCLEVMPLNFSDVEIVAWDVFWALSCRMIQRIHVRRQIIFHFRCSLCSLCFAYIKIHPENDESFPKELETENASRSSESTRVSNNLHLGVPVQRRSFIAVFMLRTASKTPIPLLLN